MVTLRERVEIVAAMNIVDSVVVDFSTSKLDVWDRVHFDVLSRATTGRTRPRASGWNPRWAVWVPRCTTSHTRRTPRPPQFGRFSPTAD